MVHAGASCLFSLVLPRPVNSAHISFPTLKCYPRCLLSVHWLLLFSPPLWRAQLHPHCKNNSLLISEMYLRLSWLSVDSLPFRWYRGQHVCPRHLVHCLGRSCCGWGSAFDGFSEDQPCLWSDILKALPCLGPRLFAQKEKKRKERVCRNIKGPYFFLPAVCPFHTSGHCPQGPGAALCFEPGCLGRSGSMVLSATWVVSWCKLGKSGISESSKTSVWNQGSEFALADWSLPEIFPFLAVENHMPKRVSAVCVSVRVSGYNKHHDQSNLVGKWFVWLTLPYHHSLWWSQGRSSNKEGIQRQELLQRPWAGAAYWLVPHDLLSYTTQDHSERTGPSPINQ